MASRKKQATSRKKDGIHFVNARPSSETERLKAQRLVRAHVGRWISDQTKDRSTALGTANSRTPHPVRDSISPLSSDNAGPSNYTIVSRPSFSTHRANSIGPSHPRYDDRHRDWQGSPFPSSHASDSSDSSDDASTVTRYSNEPAAIVPWEASRIEPPITSVFDPFSTYPSSFSPEVVNLCEQYCAGFHPGLCIGKNFADRCSFAFRHFYSLARTCSDPTKPERGWRVVVSACTVRPCPLHGVHVRLIMPPAGPVAKSLGARQCLGFET